MNEGVVNDSLHPKLNGTVILAIDQWRGELHGTPITPVAYPIETEGERPYCKYGYGNFEWCIPMQ